MSSKRYSDTELFLLRKGLLIQKESLTKQLLEIEGLLNNLYKEGTTVEDFRENLEESNSGNIKEKTIDDKTYRGKIEKLFLEKRIPLTSREIVNKLYEKYPHLKTNTDRRNMSIISNVLNQGVKNKVYNKEVKNSNYVYSFIKTKSSKNGA